MVKKLLLGFTLIVASFAHSQTTVCLGTDASVCQGTNVQIDNCSGVGVPGGNMTVLQNTTAISLSDDSWSQAVNIGFSFDFYGNTYTQCVIGSNGLVSFNLSNAGAYNTYSTSGFGQLPSTGLNDAKNSAMIAYSDINPGAGGAIFYKTEGTAPNRKFYVVYANVPMFSATDCNYMTLILNETSNSVEYHISNKTINFTWNGGVAIQGVQNNLGNIGTFTPGRNNSQWTAVNDGQIFLPTSPTNTTAYTNSTIPFELILSGNASYEWENTLGQTFPYNNGTLNIPSAAAGTVGYFLTVQGTSCNSQVGAISDTTFITGLTSSVSATAVDDLCSAGVGSVTATPNTGVAPYTYLWPGLGNATTQTVNNVSAGTYIVQMTDGNGCTSSGTVVVGDTPATYPTNTTPVSCPGGSDGTATAQMLPVIGTVTYQWNDPNNQTTSTATGLAAGTYDCVITSSVGCTNTVTVVVTEIPGMVVQVVNQVDVTCNSGNDGIVEIAVTDGTGPYSYSWTGSSSTTEIADDLFVGTTTVTVTDANGCIVTQDVTLGQPVALSVGDMSKDTIICIGDPVQLFAQGAGGSSPYIYTWTENNVVVGNGSIINVTPTSASTEYCVTVSEVCGSPVAVECVTVDYPAEVIPNLSPDKTGACFPVEVVFENITNTTETINYTIWTYSDGEVDTIAGENPTTHEFGLGVYDIQMEVVTARGCRYITDFPSLIEGYPYPEADFYVTPNPASIFEPKVKAYSQTSSDIVSHNWLAEGAKPEFSSLQDPSFEYPNVIENYPLILVVENVYGCTDTLTKIVRIENEVLIFSPNTFTPDGDGTNDTWRVNIQGIDVQNFHLQVYNRWGEKVFESFNPNGEWDGTYGGKVVKDGTYIWTIKAFDFETDNKYEFKGNVLILK
ncbi:T9SS type B sorting domain-containing protein [Brumimicrobium mesophilum]|uniref:T9SS type B sorting domain-containing protein n=1 Tax=Brumimicrobium mesophilum TaxID=392717 RepID=UPI000D143308|nr:gliding motility-associated C-terminal domain-containing protein [Brumimicrobium mesophilum]